MAPINKTTSTEADRDRKLRLRVRNGPDSPSLSSANKVKTTKNDNDDGNKEKDKPTEEPVEEIFTVKLNGQNAYIVPKAVLENSPVLARMCNGTFREAQTKVINLDEDSNTFDHFMNYLNNPGRGVPGGMKAGGRYPEKLAALYIIANKYGVVALEDAIVNGFVAYYLNHEDIDTRTGVRFFNIGYSVYKNVAGVNDRFKMWFRPMITEVLKGADDELFDHVVDVIQGSDDFMADTLYAVVDAWKASTQTIADIRKVLNGPSVY